MNVVFLIGNGFDINLGLKTRYIDFYNYYLDLDSKEDNSQVRKLKEHLKTNLSSDGTYWSDLEIALGHYTTNFSSLEELELAYNDLNDKFRDFISKFDDEKLDLSNFNVEKLKKSLAHPENCFCLAEKEMLRQFYSNWTNSNCYVHIISFNYTNTLEQLLNFKEPSIQLSNWPLNSNCKVILSKIIHIHGKSDVPLIGLNDKSQIINPDLRENIEVQEYLIKPLLNQMQGHGLDRNAYQSIRNADVICIYGLSLGKTDAIWWDAIAETLHSQKARLILYTYDDEIPKFRPQLINRKKRFWKDLFLNATQLSEEVKKKLHEKIFVVNRPSVFDIRL